MKNTLRAVMAAVVLAGAAALSACIIIGGSGHTYNEWEPNDSQSESNELGMLSTGVTYSVYAELSESDSIDYFHFTKGSESIVEFEIVTPDTDMDSDVGYTLTGGASDVIGYQAEYKNITGQSSYHDYYLKVTLDSYANGGRYIVMIDCYN